MNTKTTAEKCAEGINKQKQNTIIIMRSVSMFKTHE